MSTTAMPEPSGFRNLDLPNESPAAMLSARMVRDKIDFNYSFDGEHHFVYPVRCEKSIDKILQEIEA